MSHLNATNDDLLKYKSAFDTSLEEFLKERVAIVYTIP